MFYFRFTVESLLFSININTSEIHTLVQLDRDSYAYDDTINISISWTPPTPLNTNAITDVMINIIDINDNTPTFTRNTETVVFYENTPIGTTQQRITAATDIDAGVNSVISYTLDNQAIETSLVIPFSLNLTTYPSVFLVVTEQLDYETNRNYNVRF